MRRIVTILVWIVFCSVLYESTPRPVWGVRISISTNSQILSFAGFIVNGKNVTGQRNMDRDTFIKVISGYWPSIFNPDREDLFALNGIDCGVIKDSITLKDSCYCPPMDSLWKIRFATFPFRNGSLEDGWTRVLHKPSLKQEAYLYERYGVRVDRDFFRDTSFWMLLHDVMDSTWITNYKSLR